MNLTFQQEQWPDVSRELKALVAIQWQEIALDKEEIPLDPDWSLYDRAHQKGIVNITTIRDGERLVGWYVNLVQAHPHYKTTLFGFLDLYYVLPAYRLPTVGMRLFGEMEKAMRALGVKELISITKMHHNIAPVFDRLGWRETGITYTKILK